MATYKSIKYVIPIEAVEHTDSINALSDVDTVTTPPSDYQILVWSAADSKWYPGYVEEPLRTQKAIFGFGQVSGNSVTNVSNLVSSSGVVATDTTGVGTARDQSAAASYGGDKAIFGFGYAVAGYSSVFYNATNLVSSSGVVATDTTGVGTGRNAPAAAGFGGDKAIFGFGEASGAGSSTIYYNGTNLVSNAGVVATDTTGVGTARNSLAAAGYGNDKAIFGFGFDIGAGYGDSTNITNLVSNTGVVATDTTGVGTARYQLAAAGYGGDKAIFGFGLPNSSETNVTNLVSNTGVVATDTTGVGSARYGLAAAGYGGDKAIFGFGQYYDASAGDYGASVRGNTTNLVSNTGVVATDTTGVGTGRRGSAAAGYSTTA
jgi:hypothetical protein